jgi:ubiquinone biosynthesis monooxygenase Coq7
MVPVFYPAQMNLRDRLICELDIALRTVFAKAHAERAQPLPAARPSGATRPEPDKPQIEESIRLMRVNHCGEVCAQALYQGQALVAKADQARGLLLNAAKEEHDHLAWCESRLHQMGGKTSRLSPMFYAGSFGLGVVSGLLGDKWSMGFLVETERQVEAHLHDHLNRMSPADAGSRAILEVMREDEIRHGDAGKQLGAMSLPRPVTVAMSLFSKVMTRSAYWV